MSLDPKNSALCKFLEAIRAKHEPAIPSPWHPCQFAREEHNERNMFRLAEETVKWAHSIFKHEGGVATSIWPQRRSVTDRSSAHDARALLIHYVGENPSPALKSALRALLIAADEAKKEVKPELRLMTSAWHAGEVVCALAALLEAGPRDELWQSVDQLLFELAGVPPEDRQPS